MSLTVEKPTTCTHKGCASLGTHQIVIVLVTDDPNHPIAKKYPWALADGTPLRRCQAHLDREVSSFVTDEIWNRLAANFARRGNADLGYVPVAARSRTSVHYADAQVEITTAPILIEVAGRLEQAGTTRIIS